MIALAFAALEVIALFVPPPYKEGEISGTYAVSGIEPDGKTEPAGVANITHVGGDRYRMIEHVGTATIAATCLRGHDILACGWGGMGSALGVAIYEPTSDGMTGTWWEDSGEGTVSAEVGHERLIGGAKDLSGYFTIAKGERPDGTAYTGYATSTLSAGVHRLSFYFGQSHRFGFGLREGTVLTMGYDTRATCGVVTYRILGAGGGLSGLWVDPSRPNGTGSETLTRT